MSAIFVCMQGGLELFAIKKNEAVDFEPHNVFSHCIAEPIRKKENFLK